MDEAEHLADRIIILRAGEIAAEGTVDELSRSLVGRTEVTFTAAEGIKPERLSAALGIPVEAEGAMVRLWCDHAQEDLGALLGWAERERVELADLEVKLPTLDDVFVQMAGGSPAVVDRGGVS